MSSNHRVQLVRLYALAKTLPMKREERGGGGADTLTSGFSTLTAPKSWQHPDKSIMFLAGSPRYCFWPGDVRSSKFRSPAPPWIGRTLLVVTMEDTIHHQRGCRRTSTLLLSSAREDKKALSIQSFYPRWVMYFSGKGWILWTAQLWKSFACSHRVSGQELYVLVKTQHLLPCCCRKRCLGVRKRGRA